MTKTTSFVAVPVLLVAALLTAVLPALIHLPPSSSIGLPSISAPATITAGDVGRGADEFFAAMARHSGGGHRPYIDAQANAMTIALVTAVQSGQVAFAPPGQQDPNGRLLCYAVKYGEQTIRIAIHAILDPSTGIGATVIINPLTPATPYLSAFEASRTQFLTGDHISRFQKSYPGAKWEEADCGQLPPAPPLLTS